MRKVTVLLVFLVGALLLGCRSTAEPYTPPPVSVGEVLLPTQPTVADDVAPTATAVIEPSPTAVVLPTVEAQAPEPPEATATSVPISAPPANPAPTNPAPAICTPRTEWPTYTVVAGDTLFKISGRFNSNIADLTAANCLSDASQINVGQQLHVPPTAVQPSPTNTPPSGTTGYSYLTDTHEHFHTARCYQNPFWPDGGIHIGDTATVLVNGLAPLHENDEGGAIVAQLADQTTVEVLTGPSCIVPLYPSDGDIREMGLRRWKVRTAAGDEGWIDEYVSTMADPNVQTLIPSTDAVRIVKFELSSSEVRLEDDITVSWDVENADAVRLFHNGVEQAFDNVTGSHTYKVSDLTIQQNKVQFFLWIEARGNIYYTHVVAEANVISEPQVKINALTVSPEVVPSNGAITLSWDVEGNGTGTIRRNAFPSEWSHTLTSLTPGSLEIQLPDVPIDFTFTIYLEDADGLLVSKSVLVETTCPYTYFVSDPVNQGDRCPRGNATTTDAVYQPFEGGLMVWYRADRAEESVTVLYNDGTGIVIYPQGTLAEGEIDEMPPEGYYAPERSFGRIWLDNTDVRERLGWATTGEVNYTATYQAADVRVTKHLVNVGDIYMTLADSRVLRIGREYATPYRTWNILP